MLLGKDHCRGCTGEAEVVVLLQIWQRLKTGSEKAVPVWQIFSRLESGVTMEALFEQSETPVCSRLVVVRNYSLS